MKHTYKEMKRFIIESVFLNQMKYDEVKRLFEQKFGVDYESVAMKIDDEGFI